jgi:hypothetical protein
MGTLNTNTLKLWRWIFIVLQTAVFGTFSLMAALEFGFHISVEPQSGLLQMALLYSYLVALLFLLIASPFFFKKLGKLAVIGWIAAFAILVFSIFLPAKSRGQRPNQRDQVVAGERLRFALGCRWPGATHRER